MTFNGGHVILMNHDGGDGEGAAVTNVVVAVAEAVVAVTIQWQKKQSNGVGKN